jgi:hypothetical protein
MWNRSDPPGRNILGRKSAFFIAGTPALSESANFFHSRHARSSLDGAKEGKTGRVGANLSLAIAGMPRYGFRLTKMSAIETFERQVSLCQNRVTRLAAGAFWQPMFEWFCY